MPINGIGGINPVAGTTPAEVSNRSSEAGFGRMLADAIDKVNELELSAQRAGMQLAAGEITDLHQVMLLQEKAGLALDVTLAVRNKVLEAYQEVMRMPV